MRIPAPSPPGPAARGRALGMQGPCPPLAAPGRCGCPVVAIPGGYAWHARPRARGGTSNIASPEA